MTERIPSLEEQGAAWRLINGRLAALDWAPPVTPEQIDRLRARMPRRGADEPVASWLRRSFGLASPEVATGGHTGARIIPFLRPPRGRFRPLGQALAWAAAEPGEGPPPLPERLDIGPGAFRVGLAVGRGRIRVTLEALGFTLARLAGREVAVTGPEGLSQLLALVTLDARGEGAFDLADDAQTRRLLLRLQVGEIEPA